MISSRVTDLISEKNWLYWLMKQLSLSFYSAKRIHLDADWKPINWYRSILHRLFRLFKVFSSSFLAIPIQKIMIYLMKLIFSKILINMTLIDLNKWLLPCMLEPSFRCCYRILKRFRSLSRIGLKELLLFV